MILQLSMIAILKLKGLHQFRANRADIEIRFVDHGELFLNLIWNESANYLIIR